MLEFDTMRYSTNLNWLAPSSSTAVIRIHSNDFGDPVSYTMCDVKELKSMVNVFQCGSTFNSRNIPKVSKAMQAKM